jgi:hypothetical protein
MDGRIQEPIRDYLKNNYRIKYVDTITEPGPCRILSGNNEKSLIESVLARIEISVNHHKSRLIAVSGHYDCAGNPCGEQEQKEQIEKSVEYLNKLYPELEIIGLWINNKWKVGVPARRDGCPGQAHRPAPTT